MVALAQVARGSGPGRSSLLGRTFFCGRSARCQLHSRSLGSGVSALPQAPLTRSRGQPCRGALAASPAVPERLLHAATKTPSKDASSDLNPRHVSSTPWNPQNSVPEQRKHGASDAPALDYQPPERGLLAYLPATWVPYAELARLNNPTGALYLFYPCLFSTLAVSTYIQATPITMLSTIGLFGAGAIIMRGAGCTINDLWDRNLDPHVTRTRLRPLARRAISPRAALIFTGAQCLAGLGILLQFPQPACLLWGAPSLILVALYPLAKRVTHYPQFVLGLTFSWGALMGFPALGVDLTTDALAAQAALCLYASCVSWTVLYDMIYAHMDIKDDRVVGIKSIALRHEKTTKQVLSGLAVVQVMLLAATGNLLDLGPAFFAASCGGSLSTLFLMISKVRLHDPRSCWWWFRYGAWMTGSAVTLGLFGSYITGPQRSSKTDEPSPIHPAES